MAAAKKTIDYRGKEATFKLPDTLNIALASQLYNEILSMMERDIDQVTFEGGDVNSIDTSAFQLLLGVIKNLDKKSIPFLWKNVSSNLYETAQNLGLVDDLALTIE